MPNRRITRYARCGRRSIRALLLHAILTAAAGAAAWCGAPGPVRAGEDPGAPVWPLDLPEHHLTSNFMEYRAGRFHAGLDLKTRSLTGFPVRAVDDGWIARVRATPGAYGRSIYLRGASGRTYVFAHLQRFNDEIRARVAADRARSGRYRTRLEFGPDELPVRAGDVIALSGQSGTLGPHLHFEVRDAGQRPLDPQSEGFAVRDTFPPVIHHIRAIPAAAGATLQGGAQAVRFDCTDSDTLPDLVIGGPVAFSARITEQSDVRGHVLEPARIEVELDGEVVYDSENVGFAFHEAGLQRLEWLEVPERGEQARIRERWLHRRPENTLRGRTGGPWYLGPEGAGLGAGRHLLVVTARDHAGNVDRKVIPLRVGSGSGSPAGGNAWRSASVADVLIDSGGMVLGGIGPFAGMEPELAPGVQSALFSPAAGDPVLAPLRVLWRWHAPAPAQTEAAAAQGLRGGGAVLDVAAGDWPIDGAIEFELSVEPPVSFPDRGPATGVYSWDGEEWDFEGALLAPANPSGPSRLGVDRRRPHSVFEDVAPPRFVAAAERTLVVAAGPPRVDPAVSPPRWAIVPIGVVDDGSGLDAASIEVELDGRRLVVEPDLLRDRLLVELPDTCGAGPHALRIGVADRAGNEAAAAWDVLCTPSTE